MTRTAFYYDNRSNLRAVLDPDNGLTYYTYDSLNRMTSVKNPWGEVTQYEYSPGGRLLKRLLGNGTLAYYSYDAVGQVRKVENVKSDLTVISSFGYERKAVGSPMSILREDGSVVYYEYDPKQQLTKETHVDALGVEVYGWTWDYDPAGNRTRQVFNGVETTYQYNAVNELTEETTDGATTYFEYDHNGNTTAQIAPAGTTQYHWDRESLMTQVDLPDDGHSYFAYDADGKRVERRDGAGYTKFAYLPFRLPEVLQERDAADALQAQYTHGTGLEAMRRGSTSSFYHYDWLGSTFDLTDASGTLSDSYLYDAWGNQLATSGATTSPFGYVGRLGYYTEATLGLQYLRARWYQPAAGRFLSTDPVGPASAYRYVGNWPIGAVDPSGMQGGPADVYIEPYYPGRSRRPVPHDDPRVVRPLPSAQPGTPPMILPYRPRMAPDPWYSGTWIPYFWESYWEYYVSDPLAKASESGYSPLGCLVDCLEKAGALRTLQMLSASSPLAALLWQVGTLPKFAYALR